MTPRYPFSAVVGLDDLRLALLLTAVSPGHRRACWCAARRAPPSPRSCGRSPRCCPRSTSSPAAASPATRPPPTPTCPDGPHDADGARRAAGRASLVELPVGATEDRVVGTLDLQRALADGVKAYEPGLLAAAHRGVLYVDEVNLLPDHLVDLLLDAAAMGRAHVERDGVSVQHAARFLLVGTMNPEEGEPRPQLVDRFGLVVVGDRARASRAPRAEVVRRRLAYEADPDGVRRPVGPATDAALAGADRRGPRPAARGARCPTRSWTGSPGSAWRTGWTGCAPTSWWPGPRSRWPPGTAATG